jgi:DNA-binding response OmpR family regulator
MTHPRQIFASERLLQDIWDYPPGTGSPDLVRMHIKNLRKKIEPDPKNPVYLKTIPRRGYVLLLNPEQ